MEIYSTFRNPEYLCGLSRCFSLTDPKQTLTLSFGQVGTGRTHQLACFLENIRINSAKEVDARKDVASYLFSADMQYAVMPLAAMDGKRDAFAHSVFGS